MSSQQAGATASRTYLRLALQSTDEDVIRRFAEIVGGTVAGPYLRATPAARKPYWIWSCGSTSAVALVRDRRFGRLLCRRRRGQIAAVLRRVRVNEPYAPTLATHCGRGHELTPENTYRYGQSKRQCRTCKREAVARWRKRHGRHE